MGRFDQSVPDSSIEYEIHTLCWTFAVVMHSEDLPEDYLRRCFTRSRCHHCRGLGAVRSRSRHDVPVLRLLLGQHRSSHTGSWDLRSDWFVVPEQALECSVRLLAGVGVPVLLPPLWLRRPLVRLVLLLWLLLRLPP